MIDITNEVIDRVQRNNHQKTIFFYDEQGKYTHFRITNKHIRNNTFLLMDNVIYDITSSSKGSFKANIKSVIDKSIYEVSAELKELRKINNRIINQLIKK